MAESAFLVEKVYWLPKADLLVLTGHLVGDVGPGMLVDLPVAIKGPGPVPVHSVEFVDFGQAGALPAITVAQVYLDQAPLMEYSDLEGRTLAILPGPDDA